MSFGYFYAPLSSSSSLLPPISSFFCLGLFCLLVCFSAAPAAMALHGSREVSLKIDANVSHRYIKILYTFLARWSGETPQTGKILNGVVQIRAVLPLLHH